MVAFKDLFSSQSIDYAQFRPTYPESLFSYLASLVSNHEIAWDVGTGNGQAAVKLAEHFKFVVASDPSEKQLLNAEKHPRVEYRLGPAESTAFSDQSIDLITAAQAFHWFDANRFFNECRRVLKPSGALAFWCYGLARISPEIDDLIYQLYEGILGSYWERERKLVEEGYRSVPMPFQEVTPPPFEMTAQWTLSHLIGYLGTWSALQTYVRKNGENPLDAMIDAFRTAWGEEAGRTVRWQLSVRIGRVET